MVAIGRPASRLAHRAEGEAHPVHDDNPTGAIVADM
ncbi:MAG: hypothetical protein K0S70_1955 [Microbacterium sp.]|nr:hypothetical protein [Microbacterium sp.]